MSPERTGSRRENPHPSRPETRLRYVCDGRYALTDAEGGQITAAKDDLVRVRR